MIRMSTPSRASQVGMAIHTSPKGRPEENDSRLTAAVRRLRKASHTARQEEGRTLMARRLRGWWVVPESGYS